MSASNRSTQKRLISVIIFLMFILSPVFPKEKVSFINSWKFLKADSANAKNASFSDETWESVSLPHTWNLEDGADGGNNYYKGIGWYRKKYSFSEVTAGKRVFIYFEAASKVADVYVNGTFAGRHEGGYSAFCFEITNLVVPGNENLVAVKVDNSASLDVAPSLTADFTQWGGLCRKVWLLVTDEICISPLDYASSGVYLVPHPGGISSISAAYSAVTLVNNGSSVSKLCKVEIKVKDASGSLVNTVSGQMEVQAGSETEIVNEIMINSPHLWKGIVDPYLYSVEIILTADGKVVDSATEPLGVRYFSVDPEKGFFLNGNVYDLHGVAIHEDRAGKGRAISDEDREQDISLMREMGVTFIRLAHYQHAPHIYELADQQGIILWTEAPLVNDIVHNDIFKNSIKNMLRELIKQNFNHPSVCFWGLYNELRANSYPDTLVSEMKIIANDLDPSRPTTAATNQANAVTANWIPDIVAWNKYLGWYGSAPENFAATMDNIHNSFPDRCVGLSEYGAGANVNQHEQYPVHPSTTGQWHPEEYQSYFHEVHWNAIKNRPYIWCSAIWNGFDFAADNRNEGDQPGINDKGMVTRDRSVRKDIFYYYKANWNNTPVVYISSRRYTERYDSITYIKVYANCDSVRYFLNGFYEGTVTKSGLSDSAVFTLDNVKLKSGANNIVVAGYRSGIPYYDDCIWNCRGKASDNDSITVAWSEAGAEQITESNYKENAYDGNLFTRWAGSTVLSENWITLHFSESQEISGVRIMFYKGDTRTYRIKITAGGRVVFMGPTYTTTGYCLITFSPVLTDSIRIEAIAANSDGGNWLTIWEMAVLKSQTTGIDLPDDNLVLSVSAAPNPFREQTVISFSIPSSSKTEIIIADITGKIILHNISENRSSGQETIRYIWDGTDQNKKPVHKGIYIVKVKSGDWYGHCKIIRTL